MKFVGYHETLPIKAGQTVTIKKGTIIKKGNELVEAKRTYKVVVHHTLSGSNALTEDLKVGEPTSNPSVRWAGAGGYWCEVDLNDIPEAQ